MNISTETINALNEMGYTIHFQDMYLNLCEPVKATEMYIGFLKFDSENIEYIGKTIKATKKETTLNYILDKINSEKIYKNFSTEFNKIISKSGLSAYPTTYGIGIFVAVGFRASIENTKEKIEKALNETGIKYTTEYSLGGWVFRYKISKSKENISILENYNKQ